MNPMRTFYHGIHFATELRENPEKFNAVAGDYARHAPRILAFSVTSENSVAKSFSVFLLPRFDSSTFWFYFGLFSSVFRPKPFQRFDFLPLAVGPLPKKNRFF